jgi:hypothetical protein
MLGLPVLDGPFCIVSLERARAGARRERKSERARASDETWVYLNLRESGGSASEPRSGGDGIAKWKMKLGWELGVRSQRRGALWGERGGVFFC